MTDKFKDITNDELIEEMEQRSLECNIADDLRCQIDDLDITLQEESERLHHATGPQDDIQKLCDSYQYDCERVHAGKLKDFLVEHGGLIA